MQGAKSHVPKSKAPKGKKVAPLLSDSKVLADTKKIGAGTASEEPQSTTVDTIVAGSTQACPQSEVISTKPSTSANIPTVENSVLNEVVNVSIGEVVKSADCVEASRAVIGGESGKEDVGRRVVVVDGKDGAESVKEGEPSLSVTKGTGATEVWRVKIQAFGYTRPGGLHRKKVTRRATSPRQCLAKIRSIRGKLSGIAIEEEVIDEATVEGSGAEIGVSEGNQISEVAETVTKETILSVKGDGLEDAVAKGSECDQEDEDLVNVCKDIDDFVENLHKEDLGVQTGVELGGVPVPEEAVVEETVTVPAAVQDSRCCEQMEEDVSQKTASQAGTQMEDDQDLVPLVRLKKMAKGKDKRKVVFAKESVQDAAEKGIKAGGVGSSKKRKREAAIPVSTDAGRCEVPSPETDSVPVGVVKKGVWFINRDASRKWSCVLKRKIIPERVLEVPSYKGKEVIAVLKESDLFWTVNRCKPFNEQLVREAMANLPPQFGVVGESDYGVLLVWSSDLVLVPMRAGPLLWNWANCQSARAFSLVFRHCPPYFPF